jgi:hypothetical protein
MIWIHLISWGSRTSLSGNRNLFREQNIQYQVTVEYHKKAEAAFQETVILSVVTRRRCGE